MTTISPMASQGGNELKLVSYMRFSSKEYMWKHFSKTVITYKLIFFDGHSKGVPHFDIWSLIWTNNFPQTKAYG